MPYTLSSFRICGLSLLLCTACSGDGNDSDGNGTGGQPTGGVWVPGGTGGTPGAVGGATGGVPATTSSRFSFFVTSLAAMQALSQNTNGFGGDLRYGQADGLAGADRICAEIAEVSMPGAGQKQWRAFLSTSSVDAIDRIGNGPWYDRTGRLLANNVSELQNTRPVNADPAIINDLPNEFGVPNHDPDGTGQVDNHHFLTGSDAEGRLYGPTSTCSDWTSTDANAGRPRIGFSWPMQNRQHWISGQDEAGCAAGMNIGNNFGGGSREATVGSGGGYGGIYCFALTP